MTDSAIPEVLHRFPHAVRTMPLVAQLSSQSGFLRYFFQKPRLPNIMGQGLFTIDVFTCLHGHQGDISMSMVWSRTNNRIQCLFFLHHLPKVNVFRYFEVRGFLLEMLLNNFLHWPSACFKSVIEISEVPIVGRVGDGSDLHVVKFKQVFCVLTSVAACPYYSYIHLITRGYKPIPS